MKAVTLIELLVAIVLLSIIVVGIANIDFFGQFHVISSDRKTKLENEASLVLEHMTKELSNAIGDFNQLPVNITTIAGDAAIRVWVDNGDGRRDDATDREIAYRWTAASGGPGDRYQIWYYDTCKGPNCTALGSVGPEVIANRITIFNRNVTANYVSVSIGACWDPTIAMSPDNPCVNMSSSIKMPSVSTN